RDLQQQADHRREAAETAGQTMPEQHAEQAGAEEAGEQAAEEAAAQEPWPVEEAAARRGGRPLRKRATRLARLGHAALDRPRGLRRRGRRRRRPGLRAATAEAGAAPGAGVGI